MEFSNSRNADLFAAPCVNTLMQKTHNKNKSNLIFDVTYEGSQENLQNTGIWYAVRWYLSQ